MKIKKNESIKALKRPISFTCAPDVIDEAKDNAWRSRKSLSEVLESLLVKWNRTKRKEVPQK